MSMATMTSTHRGFGTPASLTLTPTQNTAPVHEFRCLYTRDLHKKSKKWHDGSVKFHTFNRRVMVYDDAQGFIGDLHYRKEEAFGEGTEVRLDRGILVDVGEPLGQTETDVSQLVERQRPDQDRPSAPLSARLQSTGPSQRPKSLIELLGPSQGRLGRARIPYQSPYEQRHAQSILEPEEPPPKRQKVASTITRPQVAIAVPTRQAVRPRLPQSVPPSKPTSCTNRSDEPPIEFEEILDLSSDAESRPPISKRSSQAKNSRQDRRAALQNNDRPVARLHERVAIHRADPAPKVVEATLAKKRTKRDSRPSVPQSHASHLSSRRSGPKGTGRLLLSQPRARSNLAILQPNPTLSRHTTASPRVRARENSPRDRSTRFASVQYKENDIHAQPGVVQEDRQHVTQHGASLFQLPQQGEVPVDMSSSPLFVPEGADAPAMKSPSVRSLQDDFETLSHDCDLETEQEQVEELPPPVMHAGHAATSDEHEDAQSSPEDNALNDRASIQVRQSSEQHVSERLQTPPTEPRELLEDCQSPRNVKPLTLLANTTGDEIQPAGLPPGQVTTNTAERTVEDTAIDRETRQDDLPKLTLPDEVEQRPSPKAASQTAAAELEIVPRAARHHPPVDRSFRRVFSENDASDEEQPEETAKQAPIQTRSPLRILDNLSNRRSPVKFKSPVKINRSVSALATTHTKHLDMAVAADDSSKGPTGPWTADEAFLLFDWWPAELERPAFWTATTTAAGAAQNMTRIVPEQVYGLSAGITTARQFLRDDVNAL
jgi:hypothetical protein